MTLHSRTAGRFVQGHPDRPASPRVGFRVGVAVEEAPGRWGARLGVPGAEAGVRGRRSCLARLRGGRRFRCGRRPCGGPGGGRGRGGTCRRGDRRGCGGGSCGRGGRRRDCGPGGRRRCPSRRRRGRSGRRPGWRSARSGGRRARGRSRPSCPTRSPSTAASPASQQTSIVAPTRVACPRHRRLAASSIGRTATGPRTAASPSPLISRSRRARAAAAISSGPSPAPAPPPAGAIRTKACSGRRSSWRRSFSTVRRRPSRTAAASVTPAPPSAGQTATRAGVSAKRKAGRSSIHMLS